MAFVRFIVEERESHSGNPLGLFQALYQLKRAGALSNHIGRMGELAAVLDAHGVPSKMVTTDRPGYVVYEDEYQIAAVPFSREKR